jgi:hypothetical protein
MSAADAASVRGFLDALPTTQPRDRWVGRFSGYLEGLDMKQGKKATPQSIATACRDYQGDYSPAHFRRFVDRAMREAVTGTIPRAEQVQLPKTGLPKLPRITA